jgi:bifunctional non-homologous end joining protein LigD
MGLEGIVSKRLNAPVSRGQGWQSWTKAKCRPALEVVIGGWKTEGSRFHRPADRRLSRRQIRLFGFGWHRLHRQEPSANLLPKLERGSLRGQPLCGRCAPRKTSDIHWVKPILVANVEIAEWTNSGKLRQASYKGLREDKDPRDVVFETLE